MKNKDSNLFKALERIKGGFPVRNVMAQGLNRNNTI